MYTIDITKCTCNWFNFQLEKSIGMMQISFGYDGILFTVTVDKIFNFDSKISK